HDVNAVDHAAVFGADDLPLPFAGTIEHQRRLVAVLGRFGFGAGQSRINHHRAAVAENIGGAQPVGSRQAIDFGHGPGLPRVAVVVKHGNHADTVLGLVGEFAGQDDVGNGVALHRHDGAVDHVGQAAGDHVPLPA